MIKLVEVKKINDYNLMEKKEEALYQLDEIWINPDSILQIKSDSAMKNNLLRGYLPNKMDERQEFSKILFGTGNNVSSVTVIGTAEVVAEKIYKSPSRVILKG